MPPTYIKISLGQKPLHSYLTDQIFNYINILETKCIDSFNCDWIDPYCVFMDSSPKNYNSVIIYKLFQICMTFSFWNTK